MATIKVIIRNGKTTIEVIDAVDSSCADLTSAIEKALGGDADRQYKPEYHIPKSTETGQWQ